MAKFYELADKVTNCTDNCKSCLEEDAKTRGIEVGDKVRYVAEDTEAEKELGYFPPKGTIGTVIGIDSFDDVVPYYIKWPKGTTKWNGCWYVEREDIELVKNFD